MKKHVGIFVVVGILVVIAVVVLVDKWRDVEELTGGLSPEAGSQLVSGLDDANLSKEPGWYYGDTHTHSRYSDGKGSVKDNVTAARSKGLSFLFTTDHDKLTQIVEVMAEDDKYDDFLALVGQEITWGGWGHANALFVQRVVDRKLPPQVTIDETLLQGGLYFINHPYVDGGIWTDWDVEGYTGIEVVNLGGAHPRAFIKWDEVLNSGKKVMGIAASDAHTPERVGDARTCAYLERLSKDEVFQSLSNGHFYGTYGAGGARGPDLRFEANGSIMGSTLLIEAGDEVAFDVQAWAEGNDLIKVRVIKDGIIFQEWIPSDGAFAVTFSDRPDDDAWYRLEVVQGKDFPFTTWIDGDDDKYAWGVSGTGFAFSNPVWVEVR